MKSGKGNANNRSGTAGGSKGKGKKRKVVNTQANTSSPDNNKSKRESRNSDNRNGHNGSISNSLGRQRINGDDSTQNINYRRNNTDKGGIRNYEQEGDDDRPFNMNSTPSTTHNSNNTFRKGKEYEEDKER